MRIGLLHIGQPLSMDATVSAQVALKRLSCLLIVSNINGSPYSQAVLHFRVLHFQRPRLDNHPQSFWQLINRSVQCMCPGLAEPMSRSELASAD